MAELRIKFQQNVREDKTHALFTKEELDGMSEDYLSGLEKVDDKYKVTLKMPDFFPLYDCTGELVSVSFASFLPDFKE